MVACLRLSWCRLSDARGIRRGSVPIVGWFVDCSVTWMRERGYRWSKSKEDSVDTRVVLKELEVIPADPSRGRKVICSVDRSVSSSRIRTSVGPVMDERALSWPENNTTVSECTDEG